MKKGSAKSKKKAETNKAKNTAAATAFSKIFYILAWIVEIVAGICIPLLFFVCCCFIKNEFGRYDVEAEGCPLVLAILGVAVVLMLTGLILYSKKKKKLAWVFVIAATVAFVAVFIGISAIFIPKSGAISMNSRGELRLTQAKLILRHSEPILIPLFLLLSQVLKHIAEERKLFNEAIEEIKNKEKKSKKASSK